MERVKVKELAFVLNEFSDTCPDAEVTFANMNLEDFPGNGLIPVMHVDMFSPSKNRFLLISSLEIQTREAKGESVSCAERIWQ